MAQRLRRDRKKEAFWRRLVRGRARSGLSVRVWCARHAVRESAFYWWRAELARREAAASAFVPVQVRAEPLAPTGAGRIEIVLAGDRRVHVVGPVDGLALRAVLTVLAESTLAAEAAGC